jgi:hypothetical protein
MQDRYIHDTAEAESTAQQNEFETKQHKLLNEFDFTREPVINQGEVEYEDRQSQAKDT